MARLPYLDKSDLLPEHQDLLARNLNLYRVLAHSPRAARSLNTLARFIRDGSRLDPRLRELAILQVGYLTRSAWEFSHHVRIGREVGLTDDEIARIKLGADAPGWSAADAALLRATDDLHREQFITEPVWAELARHFQERQRMDMVFTAGQYTQVSMLLNSFGVQLDEGQVLDPDLRGF